MALGAIGVFFASLVGGLVGFASSLLLLPILLWIGVPMWEAVGVNLVLAVLTRIPSVIMLRAEVDRRRTGLMVLGSTPGIVVGLLLARMVSDSVLELSAGVMVVLSGLVLLRSTQRPSTPSRPRAREALLAGSAGGLLGVTTSLNGVPPALLLARDAAPVRVRLADLSTFFTISNCLTLVALAASRAEPILVGSTTLLVWMGTGMLGNYVGLRMAKFLNATMFDKITIALVLASGVAALVRSGAALL